MLSTFSWAHLPPVCPLGGISLPVSPHFLIGLFSTAESGRSSYILDARPSLGVQFANISSRYAACLFTLFPQALTEQKFYFFFWMGVGGLLTNFSPYVLCSRCQVEELLTGSVPKDYRVFFWCVEF